MEYDFKTFQFSSGAHDTREDGMCVMEAVAYLAGEPHTDEPKCACPEISRLARWVNDHSSDTLRNELLRDMPWRIVGTWSLEFEERRRKMLAAWVKKRLKHNDRFDPSENTLRSAVRLLNQLIRLTEPQETVPRHRQGRELGALA